MRERSLREKRNSQLIVATERIREISRNSGARERGLSAGIES